MEQAAATVNELFVAHADNLNRYMYKLTRNREEAADLVQEAFLRLIIQGGEMPGYPKTWLSQTGYRLFIDQWRRKKRITWQPLCESMLCHATPEQDVLDGDFERFVRSLLFRLKSLTRAALYLRLFKQSSYSEIAGKLGCNENTVKTHIRRGRAQLAEWLELELTLGLA
ncbi:RNA polymerase sigma-70 factor (ECF subfamily) [Paenibacillus taihuensis]|uniref:RNA polymerase sigma-70 factor (ECF subfamily) n=1 Tax=Paenibacillus taihuensis TaxID=1156355 RepID=A0A3D9RIX2_9BACL|nr:RNA polymerase sigma factor [Paenibacillus taihuensis]REE78737.1 RNA polymerase sigma-70 factor (ECF subfamily) [Paenibacillus taihuensis]